MSLEIECKKSCSVIFIFEDLHYEISLDGIHREFQTTRPASVALKQANEKFFFNFNPHFNPKECSNYYFHALKMHQKGVMGDTSNSFWEL